MAFVFWLPWVLHASMQHARVWERDCQTVCGTEALGANDTQKRCSLRCGRLGMICHLLLNYWDLHGRVLLLGCRSICFCSAAC